MKKLSQVAAVATLGLACAMPVMAQSSSTTTSPSTTAPSSTVSSTPSTTMGAGPSEMRRDTDNDRDMGWIGLLGLAGLLGLRRKHNDHDRHDNVRTTTAR